MGIDRVHAAIKFCEGFPTAALEGRTLREVVEALDTMVKYATWQFDEGGRHHPTLPSATAKAADLLSHFKDKSDE